MKVAVIPARGGSKRIPRKNIRLFAGKPMIAYSIGFAIRTQHSIESWYLPTMLKFRTSRDTTVLKFRSCDRPNCRTI